MSYLLGLQRYVHVFIDIILPPTHSKVDQICIKIDENEMKLNLNEKLKEVRVNQKARFFKGMILYRLFLTQNSYARLKLVRYIYRIISFKIILHCDKMRFEFVVLMCYSNFFLSFWILKKCRKHKCRVSSFGRAVDL